MRWIASHGGRGPPHPHARRRLPVPAGHARTRPSPAGCACCTRPTRSPSSWSRPAAWPAPAASALLDLCSPTDTAPARRRCLRLARRSRAHRALPPRPRPAGVRRSPLFGSPRTVPQPRPLLTRRPHVRPGIPSSRSPAPPAPAPPSVTRTFANIFRREGVTAAIVEGDSFHRYDRQQMKRSGWPRPRSGQPALQPLRPGHQPVRASWRTCSAATAQSGNGRSRKYLHDDDEAAPYKQQPGTFTPWDDLPADTDLLFYEGLHGAVVTDQGATWRGTRTC